MELGKFKVKGLTSGEGLAASSHDRRQKGVQRKKNGINFLERNG